MKSETIRDEIVFHQGKSIFILFGCEIVMKDIKEYFGLVGAQELPRSFLVSPHVYKNVEDFYKKAFATFLVVDDLSKSDLAILPKHGGNLKSIVSGELFQLGHVLHKGHILIKSPPPKKLIIFVNKEKLPDIVFDPGLEARIQFLHL